MTRRLYSYIEIDVPYCALVWDSTNAFGTCPATGLDKCYNTFATCPVLDSFVDIPVTIRLAIPTIDLPPSIDCIPCIADIEYTPSIMKPGISLGERATLSVTCKDIPHPDTGPGFDKYLVDRDYNPYDQGTLWGKFRARQPYLVGRNMRWIQGVEGQTLEEMETRHYLIESFTGPTMQGMFTIVAKDPLKALDGDRAVAPILSEGFLLSAIDADDTAITLAATGIGDTYTAAGKIAIGGSEICTFTRSGDNMTIVRAAGAKAHEAGERVQLCLEFVGVDVATAINTLMVDYAGIDDDFIPIDTWLAETTTNLQIAVTAIIVEPKSVKELVNELVEQAALAIWWDDQSQEIKLQVLRAISTDTDRFDEDNIVKGSFGVIEQPNLRVSEVWTHFAEISPLDPHDNTTNYRSVAATARLESAFFYGTSVIKKIYSRWFAIGGRSNALRLNEKILARYVNPPRRFSLRVMKYNGQEVRLGAGYLISAWCTQGASGVQVDVPVQVVQLDPSGPYYTVIAEEALYVTPDADLDNRQVTIDNDTQNINLRVAHDASYPEAVSGDHVTLWIDPSVVVGSSSTALPSVDIGDWPAGVIIDVNVKGYIEGSGAKGGDCVGSLPSNGNPGGVALYTRYPINLIIPTGAIWGGAGGGGGALSIFGVQVGGGGGAGDDPGLGGAGQFPGEPGTRLAGGLGGNGSLAVGGRGGDPGLNGSSGTGDVVGTGGAAGAAIDGDSYVTVVTGPGDIRGNRIN